MDEAPSNRTSSAQGESFSVHKFGGTSVRDADCYRHVARLVADPERRGTDRALIVVSAMAGVTDSFIHIMRLASERRDEMHAEFDGVIARHLDTTRAVLGEDAAAPLVAAIEADAEDLEKVLRATWLLQNVSTPAEEFVAGHGELWSSRLLAAVLTQQGEKAAPLDAREVLVVRPAPAALGATSGSSAENASPVVNWDESTRRMDTWRRRESNADLMFIVATGFLAQGEDGVPTTLKRNGSDLSASIFGALTNAERITIWTDVDGVLTADPRKVSGAQVTPTLSYDEAIELAYFGAKVLHPGTMAPAMRARIPITIKNTFAPDGDGTQIVPRDVVPTLEKRSDSGASADPSHAVRGLTTVDNVALINVEGTGMMGVPGVAQRVFGTMRDIGVSVLLISQASSEHSICFAVPQSDAVSAKAALEETFLLEVDTGRIQQIEVRGPCAILAAVGDRMVETPGVSARFFRALASANVNVMTIAQGSSERNLSVVVRQEQASRALRAAHAAFTLSDLTLSIGLVGPGLIGRTFLAQLSSQLETLRKERGIDARVRAISSSKKMLLTETAIDLDTWTEALAQGDDADLEAFTTHVDQEHMPHRVIFDCTASDAIAQWTPTWLEAGIHVITPNKKATAGDPTRAKRVRDRPKGTYFFSEATVGAGLPVLSTLRDLIETGDEVIRIEGVLSGTLSYLFNNFDGSVPFSTIVTKARDLGYTEPDPREDLSGLDVARKVVILARELSLDLSTSDLVLESLVPAALSDVKDVDTFLARLPDFDDEMEQRRAQAENEDAVLRYVGVVEPAGQSRVELRSYAKDHAFAGLSGSDNILAFTTRRYRDQPLIVRGPGAGPEVTAAGVFSDLLRLCAHLEG